MISGVVATSTCVSLSSKIYVKKASSSSTFDAYVEVKKVLDTKLKIPTCYAIPMNRPNWKGILTSSK